MLLYAISRFVIEFYRGDERGGAFGMSTSQLVAVLLVPVSLLMYWRLRARAAATA